MGDSEAREECRCGGAARSPPRVLPPSENQKKPLCLWLLTDDHRRSIKALSLGGAHFQPRRRKV